MLLAIFLASARAVARSQEDVRRQRVVGRLEVKAPPVSPFVLHGTIPVPKGAFRGKNASLVIESGNDQPVPTQVEIVSRYPTGEPDVVEVLARVELEPGTRAGAPVRFNVVRGLRSETEEPELPASVRKLTETPGSVYLRARDVFDNVYKFDVFGNEEDPAFGSKRVLKSGPVALQERVYGTMMRNEERTEKSLGPPLPHMMGVHAYVTRWAGERLVGLDLRVNNGAISPVRDDDPRDKTLGIIYWKELELVIPRGWIIVPKVKDPFFGPPRPEGQSLVYPIVRANEDGRLHMMGPQGQFSRRLILAPRDNARRARQQHNALGLGFCAREKRMWSWFDPRTARYFAQRDLLASFDFSRRGGSLGKKRVRNEAWGDANKLIASLRKGTGDGSGYVVAGVMGWAHPWFIRIEGGAGGEGIAMFEGHRAAGAAAAGDYVRLELLHRMNMSRQPEAAYDRHGDPVGYHAWLDEKGRIPFDFRTNGRVVMPPFRLPMNGGPPASDQVREVVRQNLRPAYDRGRPFERRGSMPGKEDVLLSWSPHDGQHMIRYTKNTKALVWLGNDSLAKDDLILSAELFHLMFHESPHIPASWSEGVTLRVLEKIAREHPYSGVHVTRDHAWGIDSMCAAYSVASPEWRERNRPWFTRVARLFVQAATPGGIVQRNDKNTKILGHTRYSAAQGFECLFLIHAMRCMNESVFRGVDAASRLGLEKLALKTIDYMFWGPLFQRFKPPYQPDPNVPRYVWGPLSAIPIAPNDGRKTPPFSDAKHWGRDYLPTDFRYKHVDTVYVWQALSFAHDITRADERAGKGRDNRYLARALDCWETYESYSELLQAFYAQTAERSVDDSKNWIGLVGKLQSMGVR